MGGRNQPIHCNNLQFERKSGQVHGPKRAEQAPSGDRRDVCGPRAGQSFVPNSAVFEQARQTIESGI
jgi:hypothetical protein